jgi:hypothetical protein
MLLWSSPAGSALWAVRIPAPITTSGNYANGVDGVVVGAFGTCDGVMWKKAMSAQRRSLFEARSRCDPRLQAY